MRTFLLSACYQNLGDFRKCMDCASRLFKINTTEGIAHLILYSGAILKNMNELSAEDEQICTKAFNFNPPQKKNEYEFHIARALYEYISFGETPLFTIHFEKALKYKSIDEIIEIEHAHEYTNSLQEKIPSNIATQCAGTRNGVIDSAIEQTAFWNLLVSTTNILTAADQHTVFGSDWNISLNNLGVAGNGASATGNVGNNYLFAGTNPTNAVANSRFVCALDKMIDDGIFNTGTIRSNNNYTQATDCWTLTTQATILIKVLP